MIMNLIKLTELKRENPNDNSGFVEYPALVNAREIVQVVVNKLTRSGPHIIGSGPPTREISVITTTAGTQLAVIESQDEILKRVGFDSIKAANGATNVH